MDDVVAAVRPVTLRDQVFDQIRRAILEHRLKPGDNIHEPDLTRLLGVSRTPLREALSLLERDGLVRNAPNRGWFVVELTPQDIAEIFLLRTALENLAAETIIGRVDETRFAELEALIQQQVAATVSGDRQARTVLDLRFHQRLVEYSGNRRLLSMWQMIALQCAMAFNYQKVGAPDFDLGQMEVDHRAILAALRSNDMAEVLRVNREINDRVTQECIRGYQLFIAKRHTTTGV